MYYLLWHDDSRATPADKIAAGIQAYQERFGVAPARILVNAADYATNIPGVRLGTEEGVTVQAGDFWIGPVAGATHE